MAAANVISRLARGMPEREGPAAAVLLAVLAGVHAVFPPAAGRGKTHDYYHDFMVIRSNIATFSVT